jgi:hypothetical protein
MTKEIGVSKIKSSKKRAGRKPVTRTLRQAPGTVLDNAPAAPFETPRIIDNDQVQTIISNYFGRLMPSDEFLIRTIIADEKYITVSEGWVRNSILTDPVLAPGSYQKDVFDCDDYVQYLKTKMSLYAARCRLSAPLAVGYLFTTAHAFSLCINPDSELFLINTQSDAKALTKDRDSFSEFMSLRPDNIITSIYI